MYYQCIENLHFYIRDVENLTGEDRRYMLQELDKARDLLVHLESQVKAHNNDPLLGIKLRINRLRKRFNI